MAVGARKVPRSISGFTLMELLAVVALLVIAIAIAAPNLVRVWRVTEMNRLDNYAKEIYIAAQDQFIGMEASGEYRYFNDALADAVSSRNLGALGFMPQDADNTEWPGYYYLTNFDYGPDDASAVIDAYFDQVMANTAIVKGLASGGHYIVEVAPRDDGTDVYAVFYSEDPNFSYTDVQNLATRAYDDRTDIGRDFPIGYYRGESKSVSEIPDYFAPRASFVNGEELFLQVSCPGGIGLVGSEGNLIVRVTLDDGLNSYVTEYRGGQDFYLDVDGNINFDILIDSMREGLHLADLYDGFEPGADLTATVEVEFDNGGALVSTPAAQRGQAKANSLYAANISGAVEVANVRHINNLRLLPDYVHSVSQVAKVDFNAETWGRVEHTLLSDATLAYNEETYGTPYINPIDPADVEGATGFVPLPTDNTSYSYDGRGNTLTNFNIQGNGPTGLFATVQAGMTIANTTLVDPLVEGDGPTGALAGELFGTVEACGVRLDITRPADTGKVESHAVLANAGRGVGGLVGAASGAANILRSFAAINVHAPSSEAVGGLVGSFESSGTIEQSYASGEVHASFAAGGLVGAFAGGTISGCYSTSDVYSTSTAGGFVGSASAGSIANCASYGRINAAGGGGFVDGPGGTSFNSCVYLTQLNYNDSLDEQPAGISGADYATLSDPIIGAEHSHPYARSLFDGVFPFANVLEDHWGNWPEPMDMNPILVYYELYGDGTYGYYGTGATSESIVEVNTLDETLVVMEDGYALLSAYPIRGFDYNLNSGLDSGSLTLASEVGDNNFVELPEQEIAYWNGSEYRMLSEARVYQLPFKLQMPDRQAAYLFDTLELTFAGVGDVPSVTYTYYYNPDFAKLSVSPGLDGTTPFPGSPQLLIRTARQLNRLGYQEAYWNEYILQDRDLDFAYYTTSYLGHAINYMAVSGPYANLPIGRSGVLFGGTYDGNNYVIIDFQQRTEGLAVAGLFGEVSGVVRNVHVATSVVDSTSVVRAGSPLGSTTLASGVLVGYLQGGVVSGSSVSGYSVALESSSAVGDASVGGLVGVNAGAVLESSAANVNVLLTAPSVSGATLGIGGLVGGSNGPVERSYAVENALTCQTSTSGFDRLIAYGGIVGFVYGSQPVVADCYGYCFAENTICADADTVTHFNIADSAYATLSNCYTLDPEVLGTSEEGTAQDDPSVVTICSSGELQNASLAGFAGAGVERYTYGETMSGHVVQGIYTYPYPVICRDGYDGSWAHFGFDWRE